MYFTSYHIFRQSKTESLWITLRFCFPESQISRLDESFQKIIRHFVPNIWECEKVRLCKLNLKVILTELVNCSNFSFQCLKFLILTKAFRKTFAILFQSYESVTKWDCVTLIWEWFLSIAPILLPSVQISISIVIVIRTNIFKRKSFPTMPVQSARK